MPTKSMTKLIEALSVRTPLGQVMEQAEKENVRFLVSRRGKPKVIILSVEDYLRNVVKKDQLLAEIQFDAQKSGLDKITEGKIDSEIQAYRRGKARSKK